MVLPSGSHVAATGHKVFPSDIAADVIFDTNPVGSITSSDLELALDVMAVGVILITVPHIKHAPLGTLCNNTPTVSWVEKMASRAKTPTAEQLIQGLAFMLHCSHAGRHTTVHVPGMDNVMADIASRPAKAQKLFHTPSPLSDSKFALLLTLLTPCQTAMDSCSNPTMGEMQRLQDNV